MRWVKTERYQASVTHDGQVFNVLCESDFDDFALYINREYMKDVKELPSRDELVGCIENMNEMNDLVDSLGLGVEL